MVSIKTEEEIELMRASGHVNFMTHELIKRSLKVGMTTREINDLAINFIKENGCTSSITGYEGFPGDLCISINDEIVHGIPGDRCIVDGDIVSVDISIIYKGYHSDAARTYEVGNVSNDKKYLLKHTQAALYEGLQKIKNGSKIGDVSAAIETYAKRHNLGIVRELVGHGIGKSLHEAPDVPNYGKKNTGLTLKTGMTIAVEPMLNLGSRKVCLLDDEWTIVTYDGKPSAHFEHTVVVTDNGYEILTGE